MNNVLLKISDFLIRFSVQHQTKDFKTMRQREAFDNRFFPENFQ
jgi:hypothetical protein